jgi:hypothetical protein
VQIPGADVVRPTFRAAVISRHAARQMERRGIALTVVREVLDAPEQVLPARTGQAVLQIS